MIRFANLKKRNLENFEFLLWIIDWHTFSLSLIVWQLLNDEANIPMNAFISVF